MTEEMERNLSENKRGMKNKGRKERTLSLY